MFLKKIVEVELLESREFLGDLIRLRFTKEYQFRLLLRRM